MSRGVGKQRVDQHGTVQQRVVPQGEGRLAIVFGNSVSNPQILDVLGALR